tara:strand:- start:1605 stop:1997 length:393 start_codon:yes stop_codon:yes gene_type:complete
MNYKAPDNSLHFIEPEYAHMLPAGSIQITEEEAEAIRIANTPAPTPPTPLEKIRALEAQYADDTAKITRQTLLMATVAAAMDRPEVAAMLHAYPAESVKAQVISTLVDNDHGFKLMYELEQAIEQLRAQL